MTFTSLFGLESKNHVRDLKIETFDDPDVWNRHVEATFGSGELPELSGLCPAEEKKIEVITYEGEFVAKRIATHEVSHFLFFQYVGQVDIWIDEGLAVWFELNTLDGKLHETANIATRLHVRDLIREHMEKGEFLAVREIVRTRDWRDFRYFLVEEGIIDYTCSYALVQYVVAKNGEDGWGKVLRYCRERNTMGVQARTAEAVFRSVFGQKLYDTDRKIREHYFE
ncbi:MAG: hypothetical protein ACYTFG_01295 [Planctomycetota bacterium]